MPGTASLDGIVLFVCIRTGVPDTTQIADTVLATARLPGTRRVPSVDLPVDLRP